MSRLDINKYLNNFEDPLIIKNHKLGNKNKIEWTFPMLEKVCEDKKDQENIDNRNNEFFNSNQKINVEDSMEKDISFMEAKFIRDNVNYLYKSYEDNSDIEGK